MCLAQGHNTVSLVMPVRLEPCGPSVSSQALFTEPLCSLEIAFVEPILIFTLSLLAATDVV